MGRLKNLFDAALGEFFPTYRKRTGLSHVPQRRWIDSSKITFDLLDELYERNGLAKNIIDIIAMKTFNKWFEPGTPDEELVTQIKALDQIKKIRLKNSLWEAYKLKLRHGLSLVLIDFMDAAENFEEPMVGASEVKGLSVISRRAIKEFIYEDQTHHNGEITHVILHGSMVGTKSDIRVHASRFKLFGNPRAGLEDGLLFSAYNWLDVFDNNVWALGQSYFRYAGGFPWLQITGADEEELEEAEALWRNVTSRTAFVSDERYNVEFKGAQGRALPVKDYFDAGLQAVAIAAGYPYALIVGAHAGTVSGSETNTGELYDRVESIQRNEVQPLLMEFYEVFFQAKMIKSLDFTIQWVPLWQLDAKDIAEIEKLQAEADAISVVGGWISKNEIRRERHIRLIPPDTDFDIPEGDEYRNTSAAAPLLGGSVDSIPRDAPGGVDAVTLPTRPISKIEDDPKFLGFEKKMISEILALYDFKALNEAIGKLTSADSKKLLDMKILQLLSDDNSSEFLTKIDLIVDSNEAEARTLVDELVETIFGAGVATASIELDTQIAFTETMKAARGTLKTKLFEIVKGLNGDVKRSLRNTLLDELQRAGGSDISKVRKALTEELKRLNIELPKGRIKAIAQTETNRIFTEANVRAYEEAGIKRHQVITARDDRVRPEHAKVDGEIRRIGEPFSNGYVQPPFGVNCRCSVIPVTNNGA